MSVSLAPLWGDIMILYEYITGPFMGDIMILYECITGPFMGGYNGTV